ncbi:MAG: hypothetical protein K0S12_1161 [Bacteroidetes bacterium]|jgi:hypothetical protein|nr:hypothetical protein [Bacteroidota bacterium]
MRTSKFFFLLATFALLSCEEADDEVQIPPGILTKEEFSKVLADLALAESAANLNIKNVKIEKTDSAYAFDPFGENHITQAKYDSSALFYSKHPELYKEAYDEALRLLSEMQALGAAKKDSLKK